MSTLDEIFSEVEYDLMKKTEDETAKLNAQYQKSRDHFESLDPDVELWSIWITYLGTTCPTKLYDDILFNSYEDLKHYCKNHTYYDIDLPEDHDYDSKSDYSCTGWSEWDETRFTYDFHNVDVRIGVRNRTVNYYKSQHPEHKFIVYGN